MINDAIVSKIEALIEELNGMKAEYQGKLSAKEKEIEALFTRIQKGAENIEGTCQHVDAINEQVQSQEQRLGDVAGRLTVLEKLLKRCKGELDALQPTLDEWRPRYEEFAECSTDIRYYIDQGQVLDEEHRKLAGEQKDLRDSFDSIKKSLEALQTLYREQYQKNKNGQESLESTLAKLRKDIAKMEEQFKSLDVRSAEFNKILIRIEEYERKLKKVDPVASEIASFNETLNSTRMNLDDIQQQINEIKPELERVDRALSYYDMKREDVLDYILQNTKIVIPGLIGEKTVYIKKR